MRGSLKAVRARVERLAAIVGQPSREDIDQQVIAILQSARNRTPVIERTPKTDEEERAEGRKVWARLSGLG